jgi:hypothetical protein
MAPRKPKEPKDPQEPPSPEQPSPPDLEHDDDVPWGSHDDHGSPQHREEMEAAEAIYHEMVAVRGMVDQLLQEAREAKIRRRLELVPVQVSDLMRGFQAAVVRANSATRAGIEDSENIEQMVIKDLDISLTAPIIESAHAGDPTLMLPNIKSVDADSPIITLKFSVVSVPSRPRR